MRIPCFLTRGATVVAAALASAQAAESLTARLTADPTILSEAGELWGQLPFFNDPVALTSKPPAGVTKAPVAQGTLLFGVIKLGNGPRSVHLLAIDQPASVTADNCFLYVDANQNGDLTDDGDGKWPKARLQGVRDKAYTSYQAFPVLRASYGSPAGETAHAAYSVMLYYTIMRREDGHVLIYRRTTARVGEVSVAGKAVRLALIENDNDALFDQVAPAGDAPRPLWLMADVDGDNKFDSYAERFDAKLPLALGGTTYELAIASDGASLTFTPTTKVAQTPGQRPAPRPATPRLPLLATGGLAPDFTALRPDGSTMKLSDLRGRVVVLDFWATWCGPCKASMPALDQLYRETKDQGVVVFGVCVSDKKSAFDAWQAKPGVATTYPLAFDPTGATAENGGSSVAESVARKHYNVSGIPTFYVLDREGRIAARYVGNTDESKQGLRDALLKLGIKL
jgi:peroxiredoxin